VNDALLVGGLLDASWGVCDVYYPSDPRGKMRMSQKKDASLSGLALGCILGGDPIISRYEKMGAYLKRLRYLR
jgi:hypothetical protein